MNMKTRYILAALTLGSALLAASCEKDQNPNTANRGKEKPTVAVEVTDDSDVEFTLKLTPSSDALSYAYVIYTADSYDYANIPSAYDIVTKSVSGTFQSEAIIKGDESSTDVNVKCVLKEYYQICTAAISKDGLLGEVDTMTVYIPGAHPDISFVNAVYTLEPYTSEDLGEDAFADGLGDPFDIQFIEVEPAVYVATGPWFGAFNIPLVGTYNYSNNTLTFDGTVYGDEASGTYFGGLVGYVDRTVPLAWALFGGGNSGAEPLVFQCSVTDKKATISGVKSGAIEVDIYNGSSGSWSWYGVYGYFDEDCTITFKEEITE